MNYPIIALLVAVIGTLSVMVTKAYAAEVECPLVHPQHPGKRLTGGEPLLGDARIGDPPDTVERHGDRHLDTVDYGNLDIRTGAILCEYEGGVELTLAIPGIMQRCRWLERDLPRPRSVEGPTSVVLRLWCTYRP